MERTTKIIIGVVIIAILILGILGIVYYYRSKAEVDSLSLKSKNKNNSINKPNVKIRKQTSNTNEVINEPTNDTKHAKQIKRHQITKQIQQ